MMRTTLDIDDDVLLAAKERARRENKTAGEGTAVACRHLLAVAGASSARHPAHVFQPNTPIDSR